jgi:CRISPR-associated protein Cas2
VADDKKRNRVAKVLEAVGDRVQYSVFRAELTNDEVQVVLTRLEKRIDRATDRVHVYTLCGNCTERIRTVGTDLPVQRPFDIF